MYGQVAEHFGRCICGAGFFVGADSDIPREGGIRLVRTGRVEKDPDDVP